METKKISAEELSSRIRENIGKEHFDDDSAIMEDMRTLLDSLVFQQNKKCKDDFVLEIPEDKATQYESDESEGLSSCYLPNYEYVIADDGIIYVGIGGDEMEIEEFDNQGWNFLCLLDCLIDTFGNWEVEVEIE